MTFCHFQYRSPPIVITAARRNKIIGSNYGLLYRDVAFLPREIYMGKTINGEFRDSPTICIEIKAKQGFLMCDADDDAFSVKKCRYCYFQVSEFRSTKSLVFIISLFLSVFETQESQNRARLKLLPHRFVRRQSRANESGAKRPN